MTAALEIKDLSVSIQKHFWRPPAKIVRGLSLKVQEGQVYGFVGPNGAGKTTTMKATLGLLRPSGGTVRVFGQDTRVPATRSRIGFMPERTYFPDYLSAVELVSAHGSLSGLSRHEADTGAKRCLDRVGLGDARNRRLSTYSKGMLQRAGMAQALVGNPDLLILDEPMSGLDPMGRRDIRVLMEELRQEGKSVFFSTHILPDIENVCDRIAILVNGKVRREGPMTDLLANTVQHVEMVCQDADESQIKELVGSGGSYRNRGTEWVVRLELGSENQAAGQELLRRAAQAGIVVTDYGQHRASLEDLFVTMAEGPGND